MFYNDQYCYLDDLREDEYVLLSCLERWERTQPTMKEVLNQGSGMEVALANSVVTATQEQYQSEARSIFRFETPSGKKGYDDLMAERADHELDEILAERRSSLPTHDDKMRMKYFELFRETCVRRRGLPRGDDFTDWAWQQYLRYFPIVCVRDLAIVFGFAELLSETDRTSESEQLSAFRWCFSGDKAKCQAMRDETVEILKTLSVQETTEEILSRPQRSIDAIVRQCLDAIEREKRLLEAERKREAARKAREEQWAREAEAERQREVARKIERERKAAQEARANQPSSQPRSQESPKPSPFEDLWKATNKFLTSLAGLFRA